MIVEVFMTRSNVWFNATYHWIDGTVYKSSVENAFILERASLLICLICASV